MFEETLWNKVLLGPDAEGAGGPADGEAPASAPSSSPQEAGIAQDVLDTLKHDPFPGGKPPVKAKGGKGAKAKEAAPAAAAPAPATAKPSEPAAPVVSPEVRALQESLKNATDLIEAYKSKGSAPAAPAAAQPKAAPAAEEGPKWNFTIPDQLVEALSTDDPVKFKQGLAGMAQGVAQATYNQVQQNMERMIQPLIEKMIPQLVQRSMGQKTESDNIFNDFYGTYKELNNPKLYPLVGKITAEVMGELKTDKWSAAVRDTVGQRVKDLIASIAGMGPAGQPQNSAPAAALAPKHPPMFGGGNSRAGSANSTTDLEREIADTLFGDFN